MLVDQAVYRDGVREDGAATLAELERACHEPGALAWVGLYRPTQAELDAVSARFGLHELAVEDAIHAHQRPKLEHYGDTVFCVLRPARYIDEREEVEFGEIHVFAGRDFVVTVRHSENPDIKSVRAALERRPELLQRGGSMAVLHAILDRVVDDYRPVVDGIENDIDEIEDEVFDGLADASKRIYELSREVISFGRAVRPLVPLLEALVGDGRLDVEERRHLRDVLDHARAIDERVEAFRQLLQQILSVNLTVETKALSEASIRQNEEVKKISAWAAILFAPTLVGTVYGMNFEHMPELGWRVGYPFALGLMVAMGVGLHAVFRRRGWL